MGAVGASGTSLFVNGDAGVTGNVNVSGVSTFAGNITVNGNITGDDASNISGINSATATSLFGTHLVVSGVSTLGIVTGATYFGDGSSLTGVGDTAYINATNLVVAGISTFNGEIIPNGAINFGGTSNLTLGDNNSIHVGTGIDLRILHSGGDSVINHAGTDGEFALYHHEVRISNAGYAKTAAVFRPTGESELYYNHSKKFETTNTGSVVTGILTATSFMVMDLH